VKGDLEKLEEEISLLRSIFEAIQDPFFILDQKGKFVKANLKGIEMLKVPWEELQSMILMDVVAPEDQGRIRRGFEEMQQPGEIRYRAHIVSRSGERIPAELLATMKEDFCFVTLKDLKEKVQMEEEWERRKKEFTAKVGERDQYSRELQVMRDLYKEKLKEVKAMKDEVEVLSYTDHLTGICNHRIFIQQLTKEVERQKRHPTQLSLLMIDIDYFKNYNDNNGHLAGDQVLKAVSILIERGVRKTDLVARYGGEEFAAILFNAGRNVAMEIAERVRQNVGDTHFPNGSFQPNGTLTVSIGMATFSPSTPTLTALIREADNALYRAKRAGRNRVEG